jgi:hypothetical protein
MMRTKLSPVRQQLLEERHRGAMKVIHRVGRDQRVLLLAYVVWPSYEMLERQLAQRGLSGQEKSLL